jgi:Cof subfamily protein (haloacid dehalogenase superfamily)
MFKLVLLDLDGTLLTSARAIHPENVRVLKALMERGVHVGFSTGRSPLSSLPYAQLLEASAPLIVMNGGVVRDWRTGTTIWERVLSTSTALQTLAAGRAMVQHANVYVGHEIWIEAPSATSMESELKDGVPHTLVPDLVERLSHENIRPHKIMLIANPDAIPALTGVVAGVVGEGASLVNSEPSYLEVLPPGCNKGEAATHLAAHLGVAMSEVIAFGDNKNDLELLTSCGLGVAMGNAHADVLARVTTHIGHHDTDAIARFLTATFALVLRSAASTSRS